eukprot:TRINITY_DN11833_c0_g1_i13.p1 TRINITY_DN11833_c0_g1~~TRINITY_DN11833_c0_g1_i13.p1  ORF type:complete len:688 (+),score=130.43 TRINITY_DN11833_c0_g1_i13:2102-4165(+)
MLSFALLLMHVISTSTVELVEDSNGSLIITLDDATSQNVFIKTSASAEPQAVAMQSEVSRMQSEVNELRQSLAALTTGQRMGSFKQSFTSSDDSRWAYMWNKNGVVGNSSNYARLLWNQANALWSITGADPGTTSGDMVQGPLLTIKNGSMHPGRPANGQSIGHDRYAIVRCTIDQAGMYSIRNSQIDLEDEKGDGNRLRVYVNDRPVLSRHFDASSTVDFRASFDVFLGQLQVDDQVYVAIGAEKNSNSDQVQIDFELEYGFGSALMLGLASKAGIEDVYTKTQTDTRLETKANAADVYTKAEADLLLASKASTSLLAAKANVSEVYTQAQVDALLDGKASNTEVDALRTDVHTGRRLARHSTGFTNSSSARWTYMYNKNGAIGNSSAYTQLKYHSPRAIWTIDGNDVNGTPGPDQGRHLSIGRRIVHPGHSSSRADVDEDRYAIIRYAVPENGFYSIGDSKAELRWNQSDTVVIRVYKNDILMRLYALDDMGLDRSDTFDVFLGHMTANEKIYVAVGPGPSDSFDNLEIDFAIDYGMAPALRPDIDDGNRMPFFGGAYLSTVAFVWKGQLDEDEWTDILRSDQDYLANNGVYIMKVLPGEMIAMGDRSGWYREAMISSPFIWYTGATSSNESDAITMHQAGQERSGVFISFRTARDDGGSLRLQLKSSEAWTDTAFIEFTFLRLM